LFSLSALRGGLLRTILAEAHKLMTTAVDAFILLIFRELFPESARNFVLPDHAQLKTGTLLNGIVTLFQITDLGIEARIPDFQLAVTSFCCCN
jgi:Mg2+/Co2+ transporter CorB